MQQEATNDDDITIEMSLRNFRTIHEPRPIGTQHGEGPIEPTLKLPQLPNLHQAAITTAAQELPFKSRSLTRRSNTVISQVQGAFKVKTEDMMSGGIDRAKFKSIMDQHLKRLTGQCNLILIQ
jgi:hypothetical protein